jgi:hypothetical protein
MVTMDVNSSQQPKAWHYRSHGPRRAWNAGFRFRAARTAQDIPENFAVAVFAVDDLEDLPEGLRQREIPCFPGIPRKATHLPTKTRFLRCERARLLPGFADCLGGDTTGTDANSPVPYRLPTQA